MDVDPAALGQRIAELREEVGYSATKAARRAGMSAAHWSSIENASARGRNRRPSIPRVPVIRAIADALDADRVELLMLAGHEEDALIDRARTERQLVRLAASGTDLDELHRLDPEAYDQVIGLARFVLDRARRRTEG